VGNHELWRYSPAQRNGYIGPSILKGALTRAG